MLTVTRRLLLVLVVLAGAPYADSPARAEDDVRLVPISGPAAGQWSRWRGPGGQGLARGRSYSQNKFRQPARDKGW